MNPITEYIIIGLSLALAAALGGVWVQELRVDAAVSEAKLAVSEKELLASQVSGLGQRAEAAKKLQEQERKQAVEDTRRDYATRIQSVNSRHAAAVAGYRSELERLRKHPEAGSSSSGLPGSTGCDSGALDEGACGDRLFGLVQSAEAQAIALIECRAERLKLQRSHAQ